MRYYDHGYTPSHCINIHNLPKGWKFKGKPTVWPELKRTLKSVQYKPKISLKSLVKGEVPKSKEKHKKIPPCQKCIWYIKGPHSMCYNSGSWYLKPYKERRFGSCGVEAKHFHKGPDPISVQKTIADTLYITTMVAVMTFAMASCATVLSTDIVGDPMEVKEEVKDFGPCC